MFRQYGLANWSRLKAFVGSVVLRHSDTARVRSCHWRQIAFPGLFASQHVPIASILNPAPHRDSGVCASTSSHPGCHQDGGGAKFITDPTRITADFRVVSRSTNASRHSFVTGPLFKLQLRRELFATGLIENPGNPCDLVQSRKLYEDYAIKSTHELHPDHASCRIYAKNTVRTRPTRQSPVTAKSAAAAPSPLKLPGPKRRHRSPLELPGPQMVSSAV